MNIKIVIKRKLDGVLVCEKVCDFCNLVVNFYLFIEFKGFSCNIMCLFSIVIFTLLSNSLKF